MKGQYGMSIKAISRHVVLDGRNNNISWFHPKPAVIPPGPGEENPTVVVTMATQNGDDVYSPPLEMTTRDLGHTWTDPVWHVSTLGRRMIADNLFEGFCDFVPKYHKASGTILGLGDVTRITNEVIDRHVKIERLVHEVFRPAGTYSVRDVNTGQWQQWEYLPEPESGGDPASSYAPGCPQWVELPDGHIVLPLSARNPQDAHHRVCAAICCFDGRELRVLEAGNSLCLEVGRGLHEPSMVEFGGRFYMTIRAEDYRMYHAESGDGLQLENFAPWQWDDGTDVATDQTQQHWVKRHDALYLTYTRQTGDNEDIVRYRAPMFIAQVDIETMRLIRDTEQVVIPKEDASLGNFMVENVTPYETWLTVGEFLPDEYYGDFLLAKIIWEQPNEALDW